MLNIFTKLMTDEFIKNQLDYEGWKAYQNGSTKFKEAVKIGLSIQLAQVNILLKKLEKRISKQ